MVTIKTIAEKCGLSIAAVSKTLNGRPGISPKRAEFVRKTAQEMGYCANSAAQMLKTNRSHNIGILYENKLAHEFYISKYYIAHLFKETQLAHESFSVVLEAIRDELESNGYDITLLSS